MKACAFIIVLILIGLLFGYKILSLHQEKSDYMAKTELLASVQDSLRLSQDRYGRVVAEKRVIEADLGSIRSKYAELSGNQRQLLRKIQDLPREQRKSVVSAVQVQQATTIRVVDSVLVPTGADLAWQHESDTLNYDIEVKDSTLTIHRLEIPNSLTLVTYRDESKDLHVRVTNSNPVFRTADVNQVVLEKPKKPSKLTKALFFVAGAITWALIHY